jgi:GPH family glycoside/pentoside/hexuronide:cation symporter
MSSPEAYPASSATASSQTDKTALQAYEPIGPLEIASYSLGDAGFNLYWAPITAFLMIYLTDVAKIPIAATATLMLVMRLISALAEPVFAAIIDRTHTAYGRYRPWFLWLGLPLAAVGIATFSTSDIAPGQRLPAIYLGLISLNLVYSAANVAYNALSGVITPDSAQRDKILSWRYGGAFLGAVFVTWLTPKLIDWGGRGDHALGWQFTMTLYGVAAVICLVVVFLNTRERFSLATQPRGNPLRDIADLFCSRPWLVLFALGVAEMAAFVLHTSATPYFIKYAAARPDLVSAFMMVFYIGLAAGSGLCSTLTRFATRQVWIAAMLGVAALDGLMLYLCPGSALTALFVLQGLSGAAFGVVSTLTFAMYADAADYNAWKTGHRATAMTFAMINVGKKIAAAAAGAVLGWVLSRHGYAVDSASEGALEAMRAALGLYPAGLCVLGCAVILIYDLTPAKVSRLQAQLLSAARERLNVWS